jgi:hypothetical protein
MLKRMMEIERNERDGVLLADAWLLPQLGDLEALHSKILMQKLEPLGDIRYNAYVGFMTYCLLMVT